MAQKRKNTTRSCVVVVPVYNEAAYVGTVIDKLRKTSFPFVLVDDGSSDKTSAIARRKKATIVRHQLNLGKGAALKTGCDFAFGKLGAAAVICMDGDDQHDPAELVLFLEQLQAGNEVVLGARLFGSNMPLIKIMSNRLASFLVWLLYGVYVPDIPSGFKAFSRAGYQAVAWQATDYSVELEIAVRLAKKKLRFTTVPIKTIYLDFDRGFQFLDALQMLGKLVWWRFTLH